MNPKLVVPTLSVTMGAAITACNNSAATGSMRITKVGPANLTAIYICDGTKEILLSGPEYEGADIISDHFSEGSLRAVPPHARRGCRGTCIIPIVPIVPISILCARLLVRAPIARARRVDSHATDDGRARALSSSRYATQEYPAANCAEILALVRRPLCTLTPLLSNACQMRHAHPR